MSLRYLTSLKTLNGAGEGEAINYAILRENEYKTEYKSRLSKQSRSYSNEVPWRELTKELRMYSQDVEKPQISICGGSDPQAKESGYGNPGTRRAGWLPTTWQEL